MTNQRYTPLGDDPSLPTFPQYGGLLWGTCWPDNRYDYATAAEREAFTRRYIEQFKRKRLPVMEYGNSSKAFAAGVSDITGTAIGSAVDTYTAVRQTLDTCQPAISYNGMALPYTGETVAGTFKAEWQAMANANDWWIQRSDGVTYDESVAGSRYIDFSNPACREAYASLVVKHQRTYQGIQVQFFDEMHNYAYRQSLLNLYYESTSARTTSYPSVAAGGYWQDCMADVIRRYKAKGGYPCLVNGEQPYTAVGPIDGRMWQKWNAAGSTTLTSLVTAASIFYPNPPKNRLLLLQSWWRDASTNPAEAGGGAPPQFVNTENGNFSETDLSYGDRADTNNQYRNRNLNFNNDRFWTDSGGAGSWSGSPITWSTEDAAFRRFARWNAGASALIDGISNVDADQGFRWPWQHQPWAAGSFGVPLEYTARYDYGVPLLRKIVPAGGDRFAWIRYFTRGLLVVNESSAAFTDNGLLTLGRDLGRGNFISLLARATNLITNVHAGDAQFYPMELGTIPL